MAEESFTSYVNDFGRSACVVLFVHAGFDEVVSAYAEITGHQPTPELEWQVGDDQMPPLGVVLQAEGSAWVTVFHKVGRWEPFDADALARSLKARVLLYESEHTSGSEGCRDVQPDGQVVRLQTADDAQYEDELLAEAADLAEDMGVEVGPPPPKARTIDDYDGYLESQGVALLKVSLTEDRSTLIGKRKQIKRILRAVRVSKPY